MILFQRDTQSISVISAIELQKRIAEIVIQRRKAKGLTQLDMAKHFGMSQTAYAKIESGKTDINLSKMFKFCEILGFTLTELLGLDQVISTESHSKISELESEIIRQKNTISEKDMLIGLLKEKLQSIGVTV